MDDIKNAIAGLALLLALGLGLWGITGPQVVLSFGTNLLWVSLGLFAL